MSRVDSPKKRVLPPFLSRPGDFGDRIVNGDAVDLFDVVDPGESVHSIHDGDTQSSTLTAMMLLPLLSGDKLS